MAKKSKKPVRKTKTPKGIPPRLWSQVQKESGRYVAVKIKDWRGYKGPTRTVLGSAKTLAGAKKVIDKAGRSGKHAIIDQKTGKYWTALVARVYKMTLRKRSRL